MLGPGRPGTRDNKQGPGIAARPLSYSESVLREIKKLSYSCERLARWGTEEGPWGFVVLRPDVGADGGDR